MALKRAMQKKIRSFDLPVSFRVNEDGEKLRDSLNVYSNQGRLETRFGRSLLNAVPLGSPILSMSFFKHSNGTRYLIAKAGTIIYAVNSVGALTSVKTGLTSTTKHRGITWARGSSSRHIIAIEGDGLFQFDGTNFTQLGQEPPSTPTVATTTGTITNASYRAHITFYSSSTGFESNSSASVPITANAQGILVSDIPPTADNATIDKVRVYLENMTTAGAVLFSKEIALGNTSTTIAENPTSSITAPEANAQPQPGGGRFLTEFNRKLVYAGNGTFLNDVFMSEEDLPDAFNDGSAPNRLVLYAQGNGEITGLATGLYNNSVLDPYLVIFKKRSIEVYSEINGEGKTVMISRDFGCVSHNTIAVKNGDILFLSDQGWRVIQNGRLATDQAGNAATLGNGDVDDIFRMPGYTFEVNRAQLANAFSVYYSTLDQYMTWVPEGGSTEFSKTYSYEFSVGGFKPHVFFTPSTAACTGEDSAGDEVVFMADVNGSIYTHSSKEDRSDDDKLGVDQIIPAHAMLSWLDGDDMSASYNFRELILRALSSGDSLTVKTWVNFDIQNFRTYTYDFPNPTSGFVLDVSRLDEGVFGDERNIVRATADVSATGQNFLIGFYQSVLNGNIGLVKAQLNFNKNGNSNI